MLFLALKRVPMVKLLRFPPRDKKIHPAKCPNLEFPPPLSVMWKTLLPGHVHLIIAVLGLYLTATSPTT